METLSYVQLMECCIALAAENAGLKQNTPDLQTMMSALDAFFADEDVPERAMLEAYNILRGVIPTPATDAFLAEVRAQGGAKALEDFAEFNIKSIDPFDDEYTAVLKETARAARGFAVQLRQDANTAELVAAGIITKVGE